MITKKRLNITLFFYFIIFIFITSNSEALIPTITHDAYNDFINLPGVISYADPNSPDIPITFPPGVISGWDVINTFLYYDIETDKLYVGIECSGICGDADGDGDPAGTSVYLSNESGIDTDWGEDEWINLYIKVNPGADFDFIVVQNTLVPGPFELAVYTYNGPISISPILFNLLSNAVEVLSVNINDLEFVIHDFSKLNGVNKQDITMATHSGSLVDDGIGEEISRPTETFNLPILISGHVYEDINNDGLGDICIANTVLELLDSNNNPVIGVNGMPITALTNNIDCYYQFEQVPFGTYNIREIEPKNFSDVNVVAGTIDGSTYGNVDMNISNDLITGITPPAGTHSINNDFIEKTLTSIPQTMPNTFDLSIEGISAKCEKNQTEIEFKIRNRSQIEITETYIDIKGFDKDDDGTISDEIELLSDDECKIKGNKIRCKIDNLKANQESNYSIKLNLKKDGFYEIDASVYDMNLFDIDLSNNQTDKKVNLSNCVDDIPIGKVLSATGYDLRFIYTVNSIFIFITTLSTVLVKKLK